VAVTGHIETLSSVALAKVGIVVANDSARSSFTAVSGQDLLALDHSLNIIGRWPLGSAGRGWHASSPGRGLALISGPSEILLLGEKGQILWTYPHAPWAGDFESGCTWFDSEGQPHAVIPEPSYQGCLVVRFDLDTGVPLAEMPILQAAPAGISPIYHPDGWVGLSEGEGQDATRAWWVGSASRPGSSAGIEVIDAGWDDWVLSDVHHSGRTILTTPHRGGPLTVRSFPELEILLSVDPPNTDDHSFWDFTACFVGDGVIIDKLIGHEERLAAIDLNGEVHDLNDPDEGWLVPAADGTWLTVGRTSIRHCKLVHRAEFW